MVVFALPFPNESAAMGACVAIDGVLLTRNRKHFGRVKGLKLSGLVGER